MVVSAPLPSIAQFVVLKTFRTSIANATSMVKCLAYLGSCRTVANRRKVETTMMRVLRQCLRTLCRKPLATESTALDHGKCISQTDYIFRSWLTERTARRYCSHAASDYATRGSMAFASQFCVRHCLHRYQMVDAQTSWHVNPNGLRRQPFTSVVHCGVTHRNHELALEPR